MSKLTMIIAIIAGVAVITCLTIYFIDKAQTGKSATNKVDTAAEITIKQSLSSVRGDIVRYFETQKTYAGWTPTESLKQKMKSLGSEVKTQALSADNYMIYAKMPSSKLIFCMDKSFTGEVKTIAASQKSCE